MTAAAQPRPEKGIPYDEWHDALSPATRLLVAECFATHKSFTIPKPLAACERCWKRTAFYVSQEDGSLLCGSCGPKVSIFAIGFRPTDLRQRSADAVLREVLFR